MSLTKFYCDTGRNFINISMDLWNDFKNFYNVYEPNVQYEIVYTNLDDLKFILKGSNVINDFLQGQLEVVSILLAKDDGLEVHEKLISLKQSVSEFEIIKHLITGNDHVIVRGYLDFINNNILPLYTIKNDLYETELNIRHHRSFVRSTPEEFGKVQFNMNNVISQDLVIIKRYLDVLIPDLGQRLEFEQEFFKGRVNNVIYNIDVKESRKFCEFFKFLIGAGYLNVEKKSLAKWMHRKFIRLDNGKSIGTVETLKKYLNGNYDNRFLNKLIF